MASQRVLMRLRKQWLCKQTMAGCIFTVCPPFEPKQLMNVFSYVDRPTQHTSSQPNRGSRWYHWNSSGGKQWGTLTVEFMGNDLRLIATVDSPRDVPTYARVSFGDIRWTYATDSRTYQKAKSYLIKDCWSRKSFAMNEWVMRYAVKAKWENKKKAPRGITAITSTFTWVSVFSAKRTPFHLRPLTKIMACVSFTPAFAANTSNIIR